MDEGSATFDALLGRLVRWHDARIAKLQGTPDEARKILWWPFTQHDMVPRENVAVIDSRSGEDFGIYVEDAEGAGARVGAAAVRRRRELVDPGRQ